MKSSKLTNTLCRFALPSALLVGGMLTSCEDDLLTGTPSWLGSSIYAELEERGNFTQELALINDTALREYPRILQLTGSKTLFVADDNAWAEFFKTNKWGARNMSELTVAQKKMLLKSSMIDNAYLIELLSNKAGSPPEEGGCVRRVSSASMYDSIPHIATADLPPTPQWAYLAATRDSIYMLSAQSAGDVPPMLHFLPDYMKVNNFTDEDISVITNGLLTSTKGSYVNGQLVRESTGDEINRDITCQNGYIHIVEGVPYQLQNMAEIIGSKEQFSSFSAMLERYSTPKAVSLLDLGGGRQDSLFVKRYFNSSTNQASYYITSATDDQAIDKTDVLTIDPGWNQYVLDNQNKIEYVTDGGAMLVPTNEALDFYATHAGKPLIDRYGSWDNVPLGTLNKLINNHIQTSMRSCVPSKFYAVTNNVGDSLGLTLDKVDSCFVACNGLVYQVNEVFVAPEYEAVSFPTQVREDLTVSKYASESTNNLLNFNAYLTSTGSKYAFIIPNDTAFAHYINPVSYLNTTSSIRWEFSIKVDGRNKYLQAKIYTTNLNTGRTNTSTKQSTGSDEVVRALRDIMLNHIIVLDKDLMLHDQQTIYTNMAGGPIYVKNEGSWNNLAEEKVHKISVAGSSLMEAEDSYQVDSVYNMGNGVSLVVTDSPLHTTRTTPYSCLGDTVRNPQFARFFELLAGSTLVKEVIDDHACLDKGLTTFNNYHYTVYVPSNESIERLYDKHLLASWNDIDFFKEYAKEKYAKPEEPVAPNPDDPIYNTKPSQYDKDLKAYNDALKSYANDDSIYNVKRAQLDSLATAWNITLLDESDNEFYNSLSKWATEQSERVNNFITYHIQDNALYLHGAKQDHINYETSCLDPIIKDEDDNVIGGTGRYRKIQVNYDYNGTMTVTPVWNGIAKTDLTRTVNEANSNQVTRQYIFDGKTLNASKYVYSSSYVVIHQIDEPLYIDSTYMP